MQAALDTCSGDALEAEGLLDACYKQFTPEDLVLLQLEGDEKMREAMKSVCKAPSFIGQAAPGEAGDFSGGTGAQDHQEESEMDQTANQDAQLDQATLQRGDSSLADRMIELRRQGNLLDPEAPPDPALDELIADCLNDLGSPQHLVQL